MPSYKVKEKGFFNGASYDPNGKRRVLHTEKPFPSKGGKEQVPSWLEAMDKPETAAQKKKRETAEKKAAAEAKKKAEADQQDIEGASFMAEASDTVETL